MSETNGISKQELDELLAELEAEKAGAVGKPAAPAVDKHAEAEKRATGGYPAHTAQAAGSRTVPSTRPITVPKQAANVSPSVLATPSTVASNTPKQSTQVFTPVAEKKHAQQGSAAATTTFSPVQTESREEKQRRLEQDTNPLVTEDFRDFFKTSVTPKALFSSETEANKTLRLQGLHRDSELPEDEPEKEPRRRREGRSGNWLSGLFSHRQHAEYEYGDDEKPETEQETIAAADVTAEVQQEPQGQLDDLALLLQEENCEAKQTGSVSAIAAQVTEAAKAGAPAESLENLAQLLDEQATATEEETEEYDGEDEEEAGEEDYTSPEQADDIAGTLRSMVNMLTVRVVVLAVLALNAVYFGLSAAYPSLPQLAVLAAGNGIGYLIAELVCLMVGMGVSIPTLESGLKGLWGRPTADSFAVVCCFGALVQNLVLFFKLESFTPSTQLVFSSVAVLMLLTNAVGKRTLAHGVQNNFELLTSGIDYSVAGLQQDDEMVHRLCSGLGEQEPYLMVSRPTSFFKGFLHQSFSSRTNDSVAQKLSRALLILAVLGCVLAYFLKGDALLAFAGITCIACPLAMVLVSSVPNYFMNKSASKMGTIIPGARALDDLGQANVVVTPAKDLFPAGTVRLFGIKPFTGRRVDLAILYAGSILVPACPTLRDIFLSIIENKTEILYKVENLTTEIGSGFEGWIDSQRVLVGNRKLMETHQIGVPSLDYERRYTKNGQRSAIYLAVGGEMYAIFVIGYKPDPDVRDMLDEIYVSGLSLLVTSEDFNLTGEKISAVYEIPDGCIKVLNAAETQMLEPHTGYCSECEGVMAHASSFKGFIAGIRIAANAASMERVAYTIQSVSVIITCLLVLALIATGGLGSLTLAAVLLYQVAWLLVTLMLPTAKQY